MRIRRRLIGRRQWDIDGTDVEIIRRRGETKKTTKNNDRLTEVGHDVGMD